MKSQDAKSEVPGTQKDGDRGDTEGNQKAFPEEEEVPVNASKAFELLLKGSGDFGRYQWKLWFLVGIEGFFTGFHNMGAVFLAATPDHWCEVPYFQDMNVTVEREWLNYTAPLVKGKEGYLQHSKCKFYDYDYGSSVTQHSLEDNTSVVEFSPLSHPSGMNISRCHSFVYDDQIYKATVVTEWDLVCDRRWQMSSVQSTFMVGIMIGALLFSALSDKMGRRISVLLACTIFFFSSVATAFSSSLEMFMALRFIVAASGQGMFLCSFVLLMETVSLKGRNIIGNSFHSFFAIGVCLLSLAAYFVREWRTLQIIGSVSISVLFVQFWLLPESPRWLMMQGREKEGLKILRQIAKENGKEFPSDDQIKPLLRVIGKEIQSKPTTTFKEKFTSSLKSVATLVRTPNMRRRNLIMFYAWFVTSMIYYGLTFSGANINASLYVTASVSSLIELPAAVFVILMLFKFERRTVMCICFVCGGIACIAILFVPSDMVGLNLALATFGKFTAAGDFMLVFMLSTELVPTDVRNIAIGMASMCARVGSGVAPYIVDLLGEVYYAIPSTIFGTLSILAGFLSLLLPKCGKCRLPESVKEIEAMPR